MNDIALYTIHVTYMTYVYSTHTRKTHSYLESSARIFHLWKSSYDSFVEMRHTDLWLTYRHATCDVAHSHV